MARSFARAPDIRQGSCRPGQQNNFAAEAASIDPFMHFAGGGERQAINDRRARAISLPANRKAMVISSLGKLHGEAPRSQPSPKATGISEGSERAENG